MPHDHPDFNESTTDDQRESCPNCGCTMVLSRNFGWYCPGCDMGQDSDDEGRREDAL